MSHYSSVEGTRDLVSERAEDIAPDIERHFEDPTRMVKVTIESLQWTRFLSTQTR